MFHCSIGTHAKKNTVNDRRRSEKRHLDLYPHILSTISGVRHGFEAAGKGFRGAEVANPGFIRVAQSTHHQEPA